MCQLSVTMPYVNGSVLTHILNYKIHKYNNSLFKYYFHLLIILISILKVTFVRVMRLDHVNQHLLFYCVKSCVYIHLYVFSDGVEAWELLVYHLCQIMFRMDKSGCAMLSTGLLWVFNGPYLRLSFYREANKVKTHLSAGKMKPVRSFFYICIYIYIYEHLHWTKI